VRDRLLPLRLNEFPRSLQQFFEFTVRQASFDRMRLTYGSHNAVPHLALRTFQEEIGATGRDGPMQVTHQIISNKEAIQPIENKDCFDE